MQALKQKHADEQQQTSMQRSVACKKHTVFVLPEVCPSFFLGCQRKSNTRVWLTLIYIGTTRRPFVLDDDSQDDALPSSEDDEDMQTSSADDRDEEYRHHDEPLFLDGTYNSW
jgi:hypothetical protein